MGTQRDRNRRLHRPHGNILLYWGHGQGDAPIHLLPSTVPWASYMDKRHWWAVEGLPKVMMNLTAIYIPCLLPWMFWPTTGGSSSLSPCPQGRRPLSKWSSGSCYCMAMSWIIADMVKSLAMARGCIPPPPHRHLIVQTMEIHLQLTLFYTDSLQCILYS